MHDKMHVTCARNTDNLRCPNTGRNTGMHVVPVASHALPMNRGAALVQLRNHSAQRLQWSCL